MALGALDEIAAAGRAGEILVVGFDAAPDALRALHSGGLAATVRQLPRDMGRMAVDIARRAASGEAVPALVHTGVALITADNLMEAVLDALEIFPAVLGDLVASGDALSEERTMLRTVIDALPDTRAFAKDRAGCFIIANAAHLAALGANRLEDVVGKSDFDLSPADLAAQSHDDEQAVMESGQPVINRVDSVVTPAGRQHWYLTSKVPLRDTSGAAVGLVGMSQDITALKRAEEDRAKLQEEVIRAQEMALRELSTPLIPINDQVMVMPLVGALDSRRAQQILETLLHGIADSGAQIAILDITGVPVVDTHVANALIHAAQSVRLLGAQVVLSGIRPEVAQTLVGLGIDLGGIATSSTLQNAIAYAMRKR